MNILGDAYAAAIIDHRSQKELSNREEVNEIAKEADNGIVIDETL